MAPAISGDRGARARLHAGDQLADGRPWTVVTEKLSPKPAGFAREAQFLKKHCTVNEYQLPAPALLGERLWDAQRSRKAYPKRDDFVRDCVAPLRREIEMIRASGVDIVQIDDPHLCLFVDPDVRRTYDDPDRRPTSRST